MRVTLESLSDLPVSTVARWRDLATTAAAPNPFSEPPMALAAAALLEGGSDAALLTVSDDDRMVLAAPVVRVRRYRRFPMAAIATWRHAHCCSCEPLVDPAGAVEAWTVLLDHVARERIPWLVLELVHQGGPATAALRQVLGERRQQAYVFDAHQRAVVRKRDDPAHIEEQLSARHRSDQRRKLRGLGAALGAEVQSTELLAGVPQSDDAVHAFVDLESRGWKGRNGTALASRSGDVAFFERVCRELHASGRLQVWRIGSDDRAAALACNVLGGDTVFRFKVAYDEELRRFSPGLQLELAMLHGFHRDPRLRWIDSCAGAGDTMYFQLYPDRRATATLLIAPRSWVGRAVAAAAPRAATVFRRSRRAAYRLLRREPPPDYGLLG